LTNRVGCSWQLVDGMWWENDSSLHRLQGIKLWAEKNTTVIDVTRFNPLMSGVLILIKKSAWKRVRGFKSGMLGVDNDFHARARTHGIKLWLMAGIYVEHWYRGGDCKNKKHLL
jgi:GT2 family glycosyltransferase